MLIERDQGTKGIRRGRRGFCLPPNIGSSRLQPYIFQDKFCLKAAAFLLRALNRRCFDFNDTGNKKNVNWCVCTWPPRTQGPQKRRELWVRSWKPRASLTRKEKILRNLKRFIMRRPRWIKPEATGQKQRRPSSPSCVESARR